MRRPELASVRLGRVPGIDAEDVMVITTTEAEAWSFGGGRGN
ncbi:hypothetical protein PUP50_15170 [Pseudomonas chlororaphis]|nr:hypothetical protein [Pseudomonas chlororaphis]WDH25557.1 hypothetical protein PUP50_15170 [Pseudomonas chlororaphis]